jgi:hypothetical protein
MYVQVYSIGTSEEVEEDCGNSGTTDAESSEPFSC